MQTYRAQLRFAQSIECHTRPGPRGMYHHVPIYVPLEAQSLHIGYKRRCLEGVVGLPIHMYAKIAKTELIDIVKLQKIHYISRYLWIYLPIPSTKQLHQPLRDILHHFIRARMPRILLHKILDIVIPFYTPLLHPLRRKPVRHERI